ncbi:MAG TPA: hypothetical protein VHR36_15760 [Pyrinomonadaceae bacterium]|jgi:hypothetical protein|nr:hypothetical protein [Pyrinomonadaceae bacterium]
MKYLKFSFLALISVGLISLATVASNAGTAAAQTQSTALERGYRTGYSDGYNAGYRDVADHAARDYQNKAEYQSADRTYNQAWGTLEDYKDGYQQGFEVGYSTGYDRGNFNSSIPTGLTRRGAVDSSPVNNVPDSTTDNTQVTANTSSSVPVNNGPLFIPRDSVLVIELESSISSDVSQQGDPFQARVTSPNEFAGAVVEGRITRLKRAGKVKGSAELQLSFDSIRMADGRTSPLSAAVIEIVDMGNSESGTVDSEGGVKGRDSTKDDVTKVGASAGVGAIIGAIFGGGHGAAIGAAIGGSMGTAGVLTSRGKDLRLERGQQLKIRTGNEIRIQ